MNSKLLFLSFFLSFFFFDLVLSSDASICSTMILPPLENFNHVFASVSIEFLSTSRGNGTLIWTVFVIISDMFHGMLSLNLVHLMLLVNVVNGFRLK